MVVASLGLSLTAASMVGTAPSSAAVRAPLTMTAAEAPADDVLLADKATLSSSASCPCRARGNDRRHAVVPKLFDRVDKRLRRRLRGHGRNRGQRRRNRADCASYNDGTYDRKSRGTIVDGVATFQNPSLALSAGVDAPVSLRIATAAIDSSTVTSGDQFQLNLNALTLPFHAVTTRHATVIDETSVKKNVIGSVRTLRQTLATLTLSSTAPAVTINDDWSEAFRVDVSATSTGAATLNELTLALDIVNNGGGTGTRVRSLRKHRPLLARKRRDGHRRRCNMGCVRRRRHRMLGRK